MNKRYKKNYSLDGWPIEDTQNHSVLYTDDLVVRLNEQQAKIDELEQKAKDGEHELALGTAIEHAAECLPDGYIIQINVEKHGYSLALKMPDRELAWPESWEECEGIVDEIESLVDRAVNAARGW